MFIPVEARVEIEHVVNSRFIREMYVEFDGDAPLEWAIVAIIENRERVVLESHEDEDWIRGAFRELLEKLNWEVDR